MCWLRAVVRLYWTAGEKEAAEAARALTMTSFMVAGEARSEKASGLGPVGGTIISLSRERERERGVGKKGKGEKRAGGRG
jgi:hypothetical protein